jgi:RNase P/RNase MRP subunit p29
MNKANFFYAFLLVIVTYGCSATTTVKSNGSNIPPGTIVPFGKISNDGFAENYIDADVIVNCVFLSPQSTAGYTIKKLPKNHFAFQVTGEEIELKTNELTGLVEVLTVFAPKEYSDMIFELKKGEKIQLRGGTIVTKLVIGSIGGANARYIHFKATEIIKK